MRPLGPILIESHAPLWSARAAQGSSLARCARQKWPTDERSALGHEPRPLARTGSLARVSSGKGRVIVAQSLTGRSDLRTPLPNPKSRRPARGASNLDLHLAGSGRPLVARANSTPLAHFGGRLRTRPGAGVGVGMEVEVALLPAHSFSSPRPAGGHCASSCRAHEPLEPARNRLPAVATEAEELPPKGRRSVCSPKAARFCLLLTAAS